jgi:hypothetical protein
VGEVHRESIIRQQEIQLEYVSERSRGKIERTDVQERERESYLLVLQLEIFGLVLQLQQLLLLLLALNVYFLLLACPNG